jgi:hypothetical protein
VSSVQHSVKSLVAESLASPSAALGKAFFAECPTKGTRQRIQHSAKPWIPVVVGAKHKGSKTCVWVPKVLVSNVKGPKTVWVPKNKA